MTRRSPPRCRDCGYELTGFGIGDICPECGVTIRVLYDEPPASHLASASIILGIIGLVSFTMSICGLWPLLFLFLGTHLAGMICSLLVRHRVKRDSYRYARRSKTVAHIGFWMNVPGVIVLAVVVVSIVYGFLI